MTDPIDPLVIVNAEVDGVLVDVQLAGGRIESIVPRGQKRSLGPHLDADGGALLPGLHDHHLHLLALGASLASVDVSGGLDALRHAPPGPWIRAQGYHEAVGAIDRYQLDAVISHRPVRVQHRSGALWILNSLALELLGVDGATDPGIERDTTGTPTGRLFRMDDWIRRRAGSITPDLAVVGRLLAGFGVTGVTDATPTSDVGYLRTVVDAQRVGSIRQHVVHTGGPSLGPTSWAIRGPAKVVIGDHHLPDLSELISVFRRLHNDGTAVAVHCVTRVGLLLALAAWDEAGSFPGDRVEHGAVMSLDEALRVRAHDLTVVTQPHFVAERGDSYLDDVDRVDIPDLWRCGSLIAAGLRVAGSTDAPYGSANPWLAMAAAVDRATPGGRVLGGAEAVSGRVALGLFLGPLDRPADGISRRVEVGVPADLCLVDRPLARLFDDLRAVSVRSTLIGGSVAV